MLAFTVWGLVLEALHGFKSEAYLGLDQEVRRLMWTLAHAHGVGVALLNLGFAATIYAMEAQPCQRLRAASRLLQGATVLLPGGFLAGGAHTYESDPGLGILLSPCGALCLLAGAALTLAALRRSSHDRLHPPGGDPL